MSVTELNNITFFKSVLLFEVVANIVSSENEKVEMSKEITKKGAVKINMFSFIVLEDKLSKRWKLCNWSKAKYSPVIDNCIIITQKEVLIIFGGFFVGMLFFITFSR